MGYAMALAGKCGPIGTCACEPRSQLHGAFNLERYGATCMPCLFDPHVEKEEFSEVNERLKPAEVGCIRVLNDIGQAKGRLHGGARRVRRAES